MNPAPASSATGTSGAHECTTGRAPASVIATVIMRSSASASGGCTLRWRPKPLAVGMPPVITATIDGSSICTIEVGLAEAATHVADVRTQPFGE